MHAQNPLPETLRERLRARRVIPFVGAGISRRALGKDWNQILDALVPQCPSLRSLPEAEWNKLRTERGPTVFAELLQEDIGEDHLAGATRAVLMPQTVSPGVDHTLMVRGPWPAIVTTNWDDLLEDAWNNLPGKFKQHRGRLQRFYRHQAGDLLAHMKAGVRPLLFKSHGDLGAGEKEFVFTHRQYRSLTLNETGTRHLMSLLCSEYSLLFYGCSLTDPDLLGFLDACHEGLGHAIGPHYWVTTEQDAPEPLRRFLRKHHNVEVILAKPVGNDWDQGFSAVLRSIVETNWQDDADAAAIAAPAIRYRLGPCQVELTDDVLPRHHDLGDGEVVAVSVAWVEGLAPDISDKMRQWIGEAFGDAPPALDEIGNPGRDSLRLADWSGPSKVWLVTGQTVNGYGRTDLVGRAIRALLAEVQAAGVRHLHLPLLATGGGGLPAAEAFAVTLQALAQVPTTHLPPAVTVHMVHGESEFSPLADVLDGLLDVKEILQRGKTERVALTVIHPDRSAQGRTRCTRVFLGYNAVGADLLRAIDLPTDRPWRFVLRRHESEARRALDVGARLVDQQLTDSVLVRIKPA